MESFSLKNGLTVVLRRTPRATVSAVGVVYRIGSDHDPKGRSGLACLVEGLYLACATERAPARTPGEIDARRLLEGPDAVGFAHATSEEHAFFGRVLPAKDLGSEFADAGERMRALHVEETDLAQAREALCERIRIGYERVPDAVARLRARERLMPGPLGGRRLGRVEDVGSVKLAEVVDRLSRLYKPRNAVLSVAADVDLLTLRPMAEKAFGALPPGEDPPAPGEREPGPASPEWETVGDGPATFVLASQPPRLPGSAAIAIQAPRMGAAKGYAAFLLLVARLYDAARESAAGGGGSPTQPSYEPFGDPAVLYVSVPVPTGSSVGDAIAILRATLVDVVKRPVGPDDGVRARALFGGGFGWQTPEGTPPPDLLEALWGDARRAQTGLDAMELSKFVASTSTDDLRLAIGRPQRLAAAVAKP